MADDQSAAAKPNPVETQTVGMAADAKTGGAVAVDAVSLQRRRQAIADMIENRIAYRARYVEQGAGKLTEAQFAGPYEHSYKPLFADRVTEMVYCASVNGHYPYWPFPVNYEAVIRAEKLDAGSERLKGEIWERGDGPRECRGAPYAAFPELEEARAKRRKSLGMPD